MIYFIKFWHGYLVVTLTGTSPERFLNMCRNLDIVLWSLHPVEGGYSFCVSRRAFLQMEPFYRKTGTKITVQKEVGIPFLLRRYRKHFFFPIGIACAGILLFVMSQFIWKVEISGNSYYSTQVLMEGLKEEGVGYATPKRSIDCKKLQTALRKKYTDLTWVSAKIEGTRLYIDLQERLSTGNENAGNSGKSDGDEDASETETTGARVDESFEKASESEVSSETPDEAEKVDSSGNAEDAEIASGKDVGDSPCDLVASSDGTVESIVTRSGTPLVEAGDEVKAGDVLVSGAVEIMDDNGETASVNYVCADADVVLHTALAYEDSFPVTEEQKVLTGKKKVRFVLETGGRYVDFLPLKEEENAVVTKTVIPVVIGEDFYLPFTLIRQDVFFYEAESHILSETEISARVEEHLEKYCENLEENGVQIVSNSVMIERNGKTVLATGNLDAYVTQNMFSEVSKEQSDETAEE